MDMITSYRSETENYIQHYDVMCDGYVFDLRFSAGKI